MLWCVDTLQRVLASGFDEGASVCGRAAARPYKRLWGTLLDELTQQDIHADLRLYHLSYTLDAHALLLHAIALADGDAIVSEGVVVDGDAIRCADRILAAVAAADGVFRVIL